ncbi:hypothetical protein WJS89_03645 [Sphingomicrobium sp. XHP0235]|uniref:hypothetical protein n=1 Tax=Sphingomicrobium aquimarinum TaxID=3133971 RepID=UPI0031FE8F15
MKRIARATVGASALALIACNPSDDVDSDVAAPDGDPVEIVGDEVATSPAIDADAEAEALEQQAADLDREIEEAERAADIAEADNR